MSRSSLARVLEAFFRNWPLYLLPLLIALAAGLAAVSDARDEYTSTAGVLVQPESFVTTQSGVGEGAFFSFLTPAAFTSDAINGLLGTDEFVDRVIGVAELAPPENPWTDQATIVRGAVTSFPASENLVSVTATTADPQTSSALATATIEVFREFEKERDVADSLDSQKLFTETVDTAQQEVERTQQVLEDFATETGLSTGADGTLQGSVPEQVEYTALEANAEAARTALNAARERLANAETLAAQAQTAVEQQLRIIDTAEVPTQPNGDFMDNITTMLIYTLIGIVLVMVGPVMAALLNRGVVFPDDLAKVPGAEVIAVVPRVAKGEIKLSKAVIAKQAEVFAAQSSGDDGDTDTSLFGGSDPAAAAAAARSRWARPVVADSGAGNGAIEAADTETEGSETTRG